MLSWDDKKSGKSALMHLDFLTGCSWFPSDPKCLLHPVKIQGYTQTNTHAKNITVNELLKCSLMQLPLLYYYQAACKSGPKAPIPQLSAFQILLVTQRLMYKTQIS